MNTFTYSYPVKVYFGEKAAQNNLPAELAEKYGKSNAQIILRWHVQSGNVIFPGSRNPEHIKDNFDIFDFELTDEDMAAIAKVDNGTTYYTASPELLAQYAAMELGPDL